MAVRVTDRESVSRILPEVDEVKNFVTTNIKRVEKSLQEQISSRSYFIVSDKKPATTNAVWFDTSVSP